MRFLANENFPLASVRRLRRLGHDVVAVIEATPGAKDADILARAARERRVLLTFDRDYGELIFRRKLPSPAGVIYFRFDPFTPEEPAEQLIQLLSLRSFSPEGSFTVFNRRRIRRRSLP
ncbi:MAG: DUF5615 family PIN-like protein [Anaerolineales bacterium]|nr:DUF5615 family PIN-like protein [Anaerolineales bacterium]